MSTLQHFGKGALRVAKNYTKGYSDTQAKVRDATSNDPWGPSGTQMNEIAQMSYNQNDFVEIMEMLDKRLNDKGKNWRHVFKSLTLLDYCLHAGSENVVIYFRDNLYVVKTLREFQFVDEYGKDQGANVRQKAKDIVNLLQDEARLRHERQSRAHMRDRMVSGRNNYDDDENSGRRRSESLPPGGSRRRGTGMEEDQLRRAIEESKRTAAAEHARTAEEQDIEKAIKLSKEEEDKRNKAVEDSNAASLFDDNSQVLPQQQGGFGLIDPSAYTVGLQPQFTQMQPQFTSFNPYQQQAQQEAMQQEYLRQQQEWMMQQQQQQQMLAQQQQQQQAQEEWMRQQQMQQMMLQQQQQMQQQQQLMAQPTGFGSNNPFAPSMPNQGQQPPMPQNNNFPQFNLQGTFGNNNGPQPSLTISPPPQPTPGPSSAPPSRGPTRADEQNPHLAQLIGNRDDGMDTFGNVGLLRYGGTSAGQRIVSQQTGMPGANNPFARQQQQQQSSDQPFFSI